jgi:hypothetical protein
MSDTFNLDILLDPSKAHLVKDGSRALIPDRSFTRRWDMIPAAACEQIRLALANRRTETNPTADLKTFSGIFRVQDVAYKLDLKGEQGQVFETLALGMLTKLVELSPFQSPPVIYNPLTSPDPDVRLVSVKVLPQTDTINPGADPDAMTNAVIMLTRKWPYIDPLYTDSIVTTKRSIKTVTNPVASGTVYNGKFTVGEVHSERNEDGSDDIYETDYLNLFVNITERYTQDFAEDIIVIEKEGLSIIDLNAFLATAYQWANGNTPGITRPVTLYNGQGNPLILPYPMAGIQNRINIGFDKATGTYNLSIRQSIFYTLSFGPFTYPNEDGDTRTFLHREHASLQQLNADIAQYITANPMNENQLVGEQESNGLYTYHIESKIKIDDNMQYWPSYNIFFNVFLKGAWRQCQVWVQHFANAQDAATYASGTGNHPVDTGFIVVNAVSGHASGVANVHKNLIWRGTMVEVNTTPINPQPF